MKEKEEWNNIAPVPSILRPDEAKGAMSIFLDQMKSVCPVYEEDSRDLLQAREVFASHRLEGNVDIFLTSPRYSLRTDPSWKTYRLTSL